MSRPKRLKPLDGIIPQFTQYLGRFSTDPSPTEAGQWWFNLTEKAQKYFDGKIIKIIGSGVPSIPTSGMEVTNVFVEMIDGSPKFIFQWNDGEPE